MTERLDPLIYWPMKQDIRATLPTMLHNFFNECVYGSVSEKMKGGYIYIKSYKNASRLNR